jgi:hypothetical protein
MGRGVVEGGIHGFLCMLNGREMFFDAKDLDLQLVPSTSSVILVKSCGKPLFLKLALRRLRIHIPRISSSPPLSLLTHSSIAEQQASLHHNEPASITQTSNRSLIDS